MIRDTSIEAYKKICRDGSLNNMKLLVKDLLKRHGSSTRNELMRIFKEENPTAKHHTVESIGRRLNDLVNDGEVCAVDKIECPISHMTVTKWGLSPLESKDLNEIETLNKKISRLENKCNLLKIKRDRLLDKKMA